VAAKKRGSGECPAQRDEAAVVATRTEVVDDALGKVICEKATGGAGVSRGASTALPRSLGMNGGDS